MHGTSLLFGDYNDVRKKDIIKSPAQLNVHVNLQIHGYLLFLRTNMGFSFLKSSIYLITNAFIKGISHWIMPPLMCLLQLRTYGTPSNTQLEMKVKEEKILKFLFLHLGVYCYSRKACYAQNKII